MDNFPLVSCIITTHNRINLLKRAIDSVFSQTYTKIECIVVSDNCSDETNDFLKSSKGIISVIIPPEKSCGGNYARNMGIKESKGAYLAFLDDDDYWAPSKIQKQVECILTNSCDIVHCGKKMEYVQRDGSVVFEDRLFPLSHIHDFKKIILYTIINTTSAFMFSKTAIEQVGLFDEKLQAWQEYELIIRLAQISEIFVVNEPLCIYRIDNNDTNRITSKFYSWKESVKYISNKHKSLYKSLSIVEQMKRYYLFLSDAVFRSRNAGLVIENIKYSTLFFLIRILVILKKIIIR